MACFGGTPDTEVQSEEASVASGGESGNDRQSQNWPSLSLFPVSSSLPWQKACSPCSAPDYFSGVSTVLMLLQTTLAATPLGRCLCHQL